MGDASSAHPPGDGAPGGCVSVVVVADHSAGMRALLRAQPASLDGVRIVGVAEDDAAAAEQPVRQAPDLMLLDNAMPTVDGLEAAAEIRRRLPEAKIVMLFGFSGENLADPARTAGADAYLGKVVSANDTAARILAVPTTRLLGRPLPELVSFDDHTARRRTESHYQALAASLPDVAVVVVGDDLRCTVATGTGLAAAGWRAEDLVGRTPAEVLGADRAKEITEAYRAALAGEHRALQRPAFNDRKRSWHIEYAPVRDQETVVAAMAVFRDVTDQARAARRFQLLFDEAPIGMALNGPDGRWLQVNPALCALVGYSAEELLARDFQSITHPDDVEVSVEQMQRMLAGEISFYEMDKRYLHQKGHELWIHLTVSIIRHDDGTARHFIAQIQDITERRRVEQALRDSEARYRRIVELAHEGIWTIDADARTTYVNARMAEMFGYSVKEMLGRHLSEFMDEDWWQVAAASLDLRRQGKSERLDFKFRRRCGGELWAHLAASAILADDGSYQGALAVVNDITARKSAEAELDRLACHDALTGLANRARLVQRIGEALARQARATGTVGLLFVDLDQFKAVNDSLGHAAGDQVLAQVADRLRRAVRDADTVARLGGDEFVIVAEYLTGAGAAVDLADRIRSGLADPITVCGLDIVVTASIGVALADPPAGSAAGRRSDDRGRAARDPAPDPETLLHDADMAMYQAKARGRDCWHVYDRTATRHSGDRLRLLGELRNALSHGGLQLHYQPRVDLRTGTVMGFEALVRWQHPRLGLLAPAAFITLAEDSGLIRELGGWVLREACRQAADWHARDPDRRPLEIAVNLSARQLADPHLTALLADILTHAGLNPETLTLEVTETALMSDADAALGVLHALKDSRGAAGHRRLRHRLLQPGLPQTVPRRRTEDRPVLRRRAGPRNRRHRHRHRHRPTRRRRRRAGRRRRSGNRRAA